jgi:hypothetical protein
MSLPVLTKSVIDVPKLISTSDSELGPNGIKLKKILIDDPSKESRLPNHVNGIGPDQSHLLHLEEVPYDRHAETLCLILLMTLEREE